MTPELAQSTTAPMATPLPTATRGLDITVRTGTGAGRTLISAFDTALAGAGVADFNLVTLSSVIPTGARVRHVDARLPGGHGDLLFCVRAEAFADRPGDVAWAGLGWCVDESGAGLFVEHHASSEGELVELIELSLADMKATRSQPFGPVQTAVASVECVGDAVCAVVVAAYRVSSWDEPDVTEPGPAARHERRSAGGRPRSSHGHTVTSMPSSEPPLYDDEVVGSAAAGPTGSTVPRVSIETEVDYSTAMRLHRLYDRSYARLAVDAAARQVLSQEEFVEEMLDPRVRKYLAWDGDRAIGLATLTTDLDTVPWISPDYFRAHYGEQLAREAVYYFGFCVVDPAHQGARVLGAMIEPMGREIRDRGGVVAWDVCRINDERGFAHDYARFLESLGAAPVTALDQQTWYAAVFPEV